VLPGSLGSAYTATERTRRTHVSRQREYLYEPQHPTNKPLIDEKEEQHDWRSGPACVAGARRSEGRRGRAPSIMVLGAGGTARPPSQPIIATRVVAGALTTTTAILRLASVVLAAAERNQRASGVERRQAFSRAFLLATPSRAGLTRGVPRPANGRRGQARDLVGDPVGARRERRLASHVHLCGDRQSMCVRGWLGSHCVRR
jgi:hypothetical protein